MNLVSSCEEVYNMSGTEMNFSVYATAFFNIIERGKGNKAEFVKMLLKMGLSKNGKRIIEQSFPSVTTQKGRTVIEKGKADQLRKYLRGENGISDIADEIYAALDHECYDDYIKALKDYENSKLIEFAQALKLDTNIDDITEVRKDIAACYYSIIEKACKTRYNNKNDNDKREAPKCKIKGRHAEKIEEIIKNIELLIEPMIYNNDSCMEEEAFKVNYHMFSKLNGELCGYAKIYPHITSLQKIPEYFLEKVDFCICGDSFSRTTDYASFLLEIRKEIAALDEE